MCDSKTKTFALRKVGKAACLSEEHGHKSKHYIHHLFQRVGGHTKRLVDVSSEQIFSQHLGIHDILIHTIGNPESCDEGVVQTVCSFLLLFEQLRPSADIVGV